MFKKLVMAETKWTCDACGKSEAFSSMEVNVRFGRSLDYRDLCSTCSREVYAAMREAFDKLVERGGARRRRFGWW